MHCKVDCRLTGVWGGEVCTAVVAAQLAWSRAFMSVGEGRLASGICLMLHGVLGEQSLCESWFGPLSPSDTGLVGAVFGRGFAPSKSLSSAVPDFGNGKMNLGSW